MSTPQATLLSQITGITFAGEDDPRLQTTAKDLCDNFRLDALRFEAAAEASLLEEVGKCVLSLAQQKSASPWSHRCASYSNRTNPSAILCADGVDRLLLPSSD